MSPHDPTLIALLQAGYRYANTLVSNAHEAEDLVHESWVRVIEKYGDKYGKPSEHVAPEKALFFRVIRNMHIDHYRHTKRFPTDSIEGHYLPTDADPLPSSSSAEDQHLQEALATLRVREREALFLSVIEGYTAEEIAGLTRCSRGTVLSLIHRARQKLNRYLTADRDNVVTLVTPQGKKHND